ncbi:peptidylprolyl isomerase [Paracoccus luteus]|uniref:peptidylprolyl isomerase n=1 Tax=Paracoccus luteus TaxID=2508543 RepID=UPI001FEB0155|nr:SurA N-terminal domain-containing protein [Paracoccus luteus]
MGSLRTKGKSTVVWLLMGMLLLGLGGFGVTSFSGSSTAAIGAVGDTSVGTDDYLRAIQSEMQAFSAQTGQPVTAETARALGVPQSAQARLFTAAALEDEARQLGLSVGDEAVARQIVAAPGFQTPSGQFDRARYTDLLRREGLSEAEFEGDVRMDEARLILQRAVVGGVTGAETMRDRTAGWLLERRDIAWDELTAADLPAPVATPDEATLTAWHQANADRFTAPETRKITYVWLTPEMLEASVTLDEAALRDLYQQRIDEFQQPERRMVERLVFNDEAAATAAKARIDAGQSSFEQEANLRGLELTDIDLGEMAEGDLGAAGAAVFALDQPGVVGPFMTDLGPTLFSMNAILEPANITYEQAVPDLRAEAAADRARRVIEEQAPQFEDLLAGGATLEDMPGATPMQIGSIDYSADTPSEGIAAYQAFRERARALTAEDFPQLYQLDDGGVFALRLDSLVPPALIPFDQVRDRVLEDWTQAETGRLLKSLGEDRRMALESDAPAPAPADGAAAVPAPAATLVPVAGLERDGAIEGVPGDVVSHAFRLKEPGEIAVVEAENRVFLVRLDRIIPADLTVDEAQRVVDGVGNRLTESLQADLFDAYARALQVSHGVTLNQSALNAANARIQ